MHPYPLTRPPGAQPRLPRGTNEEPGGEIAPLNLGLNTHSSARPAALSLNSPPAEYRIIESGVYNNTAHNNRYNVELEWL